MANEVKRLGAANIIAVGMTGFSGAFAFFLLRELFVDHAGLISSAMKLGAAVLLLAACALTWPNVHSPMSARFSLPAFGLVIIACVLAVAARAPGLHV